MKPTLELTYSATQPSRAWYGASIAEFLITQPDTVIGRLATNSTFADLRSQKDAWLSQVDLLQAHLAGLSGSVFLEFNIPRMGRRIDAVLLIGPIVFVVEFKVGEKTFDRAAVEQVWDYALDLKNFHEASHTNEVADGDGVLRRTQRKTRVRIIEPFVGEIPMLYELGIPVVTAGDLPWHVDVAQKLILNMDRDNVPPAYLSRIHALVLQHMEARLSTQDVNATWVKDAMERHGEDLPDTVVQRIMDLRFGEKRVAYDPSDREANHRAVAAGYTVIHGGQLSAAECGVQCGAVGPRYPPAGSRQVQSRSATTRTRSLSGYSRRSAGQTLSGLW